MYVDKLGVAGCAVLIVNDNMYNAYQILYQLYVNSELSIDHAATKVTTAS